MLVVGDVVGHGIHAAATMGRLRSAVHTLACQDLPPKEVLAHLDGIVLSLIRRESSHPTGAEENQTLERTLTGATCLYAVYDPVEGRCTWARAGHPPPVMVRPDRTALFPVLLAGPPLGIGALPFESAEIALPEGSLLALYTDGLIQGHEHDIEGGLSKLGDELVEPARTLEETCGNVTNALTADDRSDDVAIRYGAEPIRLRLILDSVLVCEVSDTSNSAPRLHHAGTSDEGGRGLYLVAQTTHRWGFRRTTVGKVVWAEQVIPDGQR
ncbi:ATP-binding SpoIIE family protein phosphatase [Streptomyces asiaticus]|uniref:ATP-binding SpoIIE family protein phosphatase n=1 Tax=Streptomyces asiaticus TaxID=114695 RepID=UPI0038158901